MNVGIDLINVYLPKHYLKLETLAKARGVDVNKYHVGIGQEKMSIVAPHEDIVTMAAEAAYDIVKHHKDDIDAIFFASETGIDFSKSAGNYVHRLLGLHPYVRILEFKQACYAATGALQLAVDHITRHPDKKVLILSSDIAWYGFHTPGEATQGAGAVAMLISKNPRLAVVNPGKTATEELPDFYRPSHYDVPIVDGKLSIRCYLDILKKVMPQKTLPYVCFHLPFANMANKANQTLYDPMSLDALETTKHVGKVAGNIYNGSLYLSLISVLLYAKEDLSDQNIGMFSYGSGAIGEFFELTLQKDYQQGFSKDFILKTLNQRTEIDIKTYEHLMHMYQTREHSLDFHAQQTYISDERFALNVIKSGHRQYHVK